MIYRGSYKNLTLDFWIFGFFAIFWGSKVQIWPFFGNFGHFLAPASSVWAKFWEFQKIQCNVFEWSPRDHVYQISASQVPYNSRTIDFEIWGFQKWGIPLYIRISHTFLYTRHFGEAGFSRKKRIFKKFQKILKVHHHGLIIYKSWKFDLGLPPSPLTG